MKVLHITTKDSGGAGLCCLRIHKALLDQGVDSKVLVLERSSEDVPEVYTSKKFKIQSILWKGLNKVLRTFKLDLTSYNKVITLSKKTGVTCSIPTSVYDVSTNSLVQWADLIHLHWVDNFIDYPSFFERVDKPIVWTQHDEGIFNGVYHYFQPKGEKVVSNLEKKFYTIKYNALRSAKSINIVLLSKWMYDHFHNDEMIKGMRVTVINNPVDCKSFSPLERKIARKKMGIPENAVVFSFASQNISNKFKGLSTLSDVLQRMAIPNAMIMAIGDKSGYKEIPLVHAVGLLKGPDELSVAYSCADYFVMPSYKEAFAQSPMESMACGVPAIVFPVSGTDELINSKNGVRAKNFTPQDLEIAIRQAMSTKYDAASIRQDMINRFSPEIIAKRYIEFYDKILNNKS
ncbi:MAG: glycosyltransferase [Prevotella sp.]|jgi:glycosyltransferase involved in cell wall biosynthesis|nr:glycosyltransferase [Prevotella sp.]MCI1474412.1 glycosyltransferase [Prevotella sp.]MCI1549060.1 glycosyltransferase [Prevotella sp.]